MRWGLAFSQCLCCLRSPRGMQEIVALGQLIWTAGMPDHAFVVAAAVFLMWQLSNIFSIAVPRKYWIRVNRAASCHSYRWSVNPAHYGQFHSSVRYWRLFFCLTACGWVLLNSQVSSITMLINEIPTKNPHKMTLIQNDDAISVVSSNTSIKSFNTAIAPRTAIGSHYLRDTHWPNATPKSLTEYLICLSK